MYFLSLPESPGALEPQTHIAVCPGHMKQKPQKKGGTFF